MLMFECSGFIGLLCCTVHVCPILLARIEKIKSSFTPFLWSSIQRTYDETCTF